MKSFVGAPATQNRSAMLPQSLSAKTSVANATPFRAPLAHVQQSRGSLQVMAALTRQGKEETMSKLKPLLESSTVVVGLRYQGLTVKQMQEFRASLPQEGAKLLVCKNTLLKRAADEVEGWSELKSAAKGDNAWLFIQEEFVADSIKAYLKFQDKVKEGVPKEERDAFVPLTVTGGAMSGSPIGASDIQRLKNLPNKKELIATIARLINQIPTKVAVSVKQVPTKLAYGVKALADADEDKSKIVGDVCKPSAGAA